MDYININLGPAKKDGHELMPWVVEVVKDVVPDVPPDTSNIDAIEASLKVIAFFPPLKRNSPTMIHTCNCRLWIIGPNKGLLNG